jgi:hypothetical protein
MLDEKNNRRGLAVSEITTLLNNMRNLLEPSIKVDAEIWRIFEAELRDEVGGIPENIPVPAFTRSVDYALLLMPDECWWTVNSQCSGALGVKSARDTEPLFFINGAGNVAIALAIMGIEIRRQARGLLERIGSDTVKH